MTQSQAEVAKIIQEKLAAARQLIVDAGRLVDAVGLDSIEFMGLTFEPNFGWFKGSELQEESEWNTSACVIGSLMAAHGTLDQGQWQSSSWCVGG